MSHPPAPTRSTIYVYVVIAIAAIGGLLFGYDAGIAGGAVLQLGATNPGISEWTQGLIVSIMCIGGAVGALAAGPLADRYGRRPIIVAAGLAFTVGALASSLDFGVAWLCMARIVVGLGVGAVSVLVPVYIAELAPARIRGMLVSAFQLLITVGILVSYFVNTATEPTDNWQLALRLAAIPGIALVLGALILPESPRYLVRSGRVAQAAAVLNRVRGTDADAELAEILDVAPEENESVKWRELGQAKVRPLVIIGVLMALFAQICGINAIIYFSPQILVDAGLSQDQTAWWGAVGLGIVNVVFTVVGMALVDRVGRKPMLTIGAVGLTVSLIVVALTINNPANGAITFAALAVYILFYAVGPGMLAFVVISEIFPLRYRGAGTGLALLVNYIAQILVTYTFLPMLKGLGTAPTFWLYAAICGLFVVFARVLVPETKGKSLEEIERAALGTKESAVSE